MQAATNLFAFTTGSKTPSIIIVGEAWGIEEAAAKLPFVGQSGRELFRMLGESLKCHLPLLQQALAARRTHEWLARRAQWLEASGILLTNVIPQQPPNNDFTHFLYSNDEAKLAKKKNTPLADYHGVYPKPALASAIGALWALVDHCNPDLIIACGNWPLHVLSLHCNVATSKGFKLPTGIATWRGSQTYTRPHCDKTYPLLPIIHPAAILRDWGMRHVTVHDLRSRASRYLNAQLAWEPAPSNSIYRPSFAEATTILNNWYQRCSAGQILWLSVDLETYAKQFITCIGFADAQRELCVPFFYFDATGVSRPYWEPHDELAIWKLIARILQHPNCKIIGQNFIYDTQYLHRYYNITAIVSFDTMVAHHLLFPGTPKTLEHLAALYCHSYCYWKDESEEWATNALTAEELWRYNCKDTRSTYEIAFRLMRLLEHEKLTELYAEQLAAWELSRAMTLRGCHYDDSLRWQFIRELAPETNKLETWLLAAIPEALRYTSSLKPWFTSPAQTMFILYTVLGIKPVLHKKTKKPTSDDTAINELCERKDTEWLAPLLLRLRDMRSSLVFTQNFLNVTINPRLNSQFNCAQPETFRWSSSANAFGEGGNLQNLPKLED